MQTMAFRIHTCLMPQHQQPLICLLESFESLSSCRCYYFEALLFLHFIGFSFCSAQLNSEYLWRYQRILIPLRLRLWHFPLTYCHLKIQLVGSLHRCRLSWALLHLQSQYLDLQQGSILAKKSVFLFHREGTKCKAKDYFSSAWAEFQQS